MASMSSRDFAEWMAYYEIEPFGAEVTDIHGASIASLLYNANRSKNALPMSMEKLRTWQPIKEKDAADNRAFFERIKRAVTRERK